MELIIWALALAGLALLTRWFLADATTPRCRCGRRARQIDPRNGRQYCDGCMQDVFDRWPVQH